MVSKDEILDGKTAKTFNSVAPAKDGKIYYTGLCGRSKQALIYKYRHNLSFLVSSTNYPLDESIGEMFGAPSGRLLVYDPSTKKSKVLKENIHFVSLSYWFYYFFHLNHFCDFYFVLG